MEQNQGELKEVLPLKKQFAVFFGDTRSFLEDAVFKIYIFIFSLLEEIVGSVLYIGRPDTTSISPAVSKLLGDAENAGFLKNISLSSLLPDEPRAIMVSANFGPLLTKSDADSEVYGRSSGFGGADFISKDKAVLRCIGEAIERTCLGFYKEKDLVFGSYEELKENAVNPKEFVSFSKNQLEGKKFKNRHFDENSKFGWVWSRSLISGKQLLVPARLVYLSYNGRQTEPIIKRTNSTGAAAYTDKAEANYRGICEAIERDAVMIHYLNKISPPVINLSSSGNKTLETIERSMKRYNLELYVLDITTDIDVPVYGALLIDRLGGPAVTLASKGDLDSEKAITGAILEAIRIWWGRKRKMSFDPDYDYSALEARALELYDLKERGMLWAQSKMIKHVEFLTKGKEEKYSPREAPMTSEERLEHVLNYFRKNKLDVFSVDITAPAAKKLGFCAYMDLIPRLQPLYLDERFRSWGEERLYKVPVKLGYFSKPKREEELNQITHPYV